MRVVNIQKYKKEIQKKIKIYMVKKTKIKIQNKYIFKTTMNKFLYFFLKYRQDYRTKTNKSNVAVGPKIQVSHTKSETL
jgi:hypothetical protein